MTGRDVTLARSAVHASSGSAVERRRAGRQCHSHSMESRCGKLFANVVITACGRKCTGNAICPLSAQADLAYRSCCETCANARRRLEL